jgi:hypothetical protein
MRKGFLGSAFMVLACASLAQAQASLPDTSLPATPSSAVANPQPSPSSGVLEDRSTWGASSGTSLRFWASAEYLLWWTRGGSVPPW